MNQDNPAVKESAQVSAAVLEQSALQRIKEDGQVDAHTVRAREAERNSLRADIDAFLKNGGKVTSVAPNLRADIPRKPQNNYGKGAL